MVRNQSSRVDVFRFATRTHNAGDSKRGDGTIGPRPQQHTARQSQGHHRLDGPLILASIGNSPMVSTCRLAKDEVLGAGEREEVGTLCSIHLLPAMFTGIATGWKSAL